MKYNVGDIKNKVLSGGETTFDEALWLIETAGAEELYDAAHEITSRRASRKFDTCSIINSKSGRCGENCKWCAQSAFYDTGVECYPFVGSAECLRHAKYNESQGVGRFSLVNSGKRASKKEIASICETVKALKASTGMGICVSLGLVDLDDLRALKAAGAGRYHCNLETAPSYFPQLCGTHGIDDKVRTLENAREAGMEICSGGILGMGENHAQRVEFAFKLKESGVSSIPLNILHPIKGTPLENCSPLTEEEFLRAVAMFRFVHPQAFLRFAGGRSKISREGMEKALFIGINAAIVGDLLTTIGSKVEDDFKMIKDAGYEL